MTSTQPPLVTAEELGIYLNTPNLNYDRANQMIDRAQKLCLTVVDPLPEAAAVVVERVAGRGYVSTASSRQDQLAASGSPFGVAGTSQGGVSLSQMDERDLRRLATGAGGGVFSVDVLPDGYVYRPTVWPLYGDWDVM